MRGLILVAVMGAVGCEAGLVDPLPGLYGASWECLGGCDEYAPFEDFDRLLIGENGLTYQRSDCGDCDVEDLIKRRGDCLSCRGIPIANGAWTQPYELCADVPGPTAFIDWVGYPGTNTPKRWHLTIEPLEAPE